MSGVIEEAKASSPVAHFLSTPKKLLIDGNWVAAVSGKTFEVKNPATANTIAHASPRVTRRISILPCAPHVAPLNPAHGPP